MHEGAMKPLFIVPDPPEGNVTVKLIPGVTYIIAMTTPHFSKKG
jgi:hypothetical protein